MSSSGKVPGPQNSKLSKARNKHDMAFWKEEPASLVLAEDQLPNQVILLSQRFALMKAFEVEMSGCYVHVLNKGLLFLYSSRVPRIDPDDALPPLPPSSIWKSRTRTAPSPRRLPSPLPLPPAPRPPRVQLRLLPDALSRPVPPRRRFCRTKAKRTRSHFALWANGRRLWFKTRKQTSSFCVNTCRRTYLCVSVCAYYYHSVSCYCLFRQLFTRTLLS